MQNHDSYRPQAPVQYIFSIQELQMCKRHQVAYQLLIELHDYVILVVLNAQKHYLKTTNPQTTTLPHPPKKPNNKKKKPTPKQPNRRWGLCMRLGGFEGGLVTVASVKLPHSLQIPNWFHLNSCWFSTWILTPAQKVMVHYLKHLSISSLSDKACFGGKKNISFCQSSFSLMGDIIILAPNSGAS